MFYILHSHSTFDIRHLTFGIRFTCDMNCSYFSSCSYWDDDVQDAAQDACGKICDRVPTPEPTLTRTPEPTGNPCNLTSFYQAGVECCSDSDCHSGKTVSYTGRAVGGVVVLVRDAYAITLPPCYRNVPALSDHPSADLTTQT